MGAVEEEEAKAKVQLQRQLEGGERLQVRVCDFKSSRPVAFYRRARWQSAAEIGNGNARDPPTPAAGGAGGAGQAAEGLCDDGLLLQDAATRAACGGAMHRTWCWPAECRLKRWARGAKRMKGEHTKARGWRDETAPASWGKCKRSLWHGGWGAIRAALASGRARTAN